MLNSMLQVAGATGAVALAEGAWAAAGMEVATAQRALARANATYVQALGSAAAVAAKSRLDNALSRVWVSSADSSGEEGWDAKLS